VTKPLAIDLCCGLGGWTDGLLSEGWRVRGYDIEAHEYGEEKYRAELVLRNVLEMHGSEIADADLIVASPPCTEYSYMAMPWSRAKQIARALRGEDEFPEPYRGSRTIEQLNAIFDACFRLQREASQAAGRYIPMVVENVKGAQPWVGRAAWNFGSFYLWGDLPALMPSTLSAHKNPGFRFDGSGRSFQSESVARHVEGKKNSGGSWFNIGSPGQRVTGNNPDGRKLKDLDGYERDHPDAFGWKKPRTSSGSKARKQASAQIAKIPFALSSHIARVYKPQSLAA
jgi:hypothetical protein